MSTEVSRLLSPYDLQGLPLANRIVMAPMTRGRAGQQRVPNATMATYYAQRATAGLIISEGTHISQQAIGWMNSPGIFTDEMAAAWAQIPAAVHAQGGKIFMQLWHCGRASHSSFHHGELPVAPSPIAIPGEHRHTPLGKQAYETPRALEVSEIHQTVEDYRRAAERAWEAGFDGVEIHGANGYLVDEFLQSRTNQRTDNYGGSIENRYRFLNEIVEAVSSVIPANRVGVRLSPNGNFNDMGSPDFREQFLFVAEQLNQYGLAYLHVMDGLAFGFHQLGDQLTLPEFRQVFSGTLMGNCGYSQEVAEEAIAKGEADLIAFGRPFITNPDLVQRFASGVPLAPWDDMSVWYSDTAERGYTDFPTLAS